MAPRNMNSYYDDDDRSVKRVQPGISRSSSRGGYSGRSSGYSGRSSGAYNQRRSAPQPSRRPASSGGRPPQNRRPAGGRRPIRRRRSSARLYVFIALIAVVLVVAILIFARPAQETPRQIVEVTPSAAVVAVTRSPEENSKPADETAVPSAADLHTTRELCRLLKQVSIDLVDHFIIADDEMVSLRESGCFYD